jgi:hypothetical protein
MPRMVPGPPQIMVIFQSYKSWFRQWQDAQDGAWAAPNHGNLSILQITVQTMTNDLIYSVLKHLERQLAGLPPPRQ